MTARRPPAPTLWLMERFGVGQDLVGDLIERFARGRSRIWFWRQALLAIAIGSVRDIAGHKLLFVRAVVIGLLAINALASGYFAILPLFINVAPVRYPVALMALAGLLYLATGWSIARLHRPYGAGMTVGVVALGWIYRAPEVFRHVANVLGPGRGRRTERCSRAGRHRRVIVGDVLHAVLRARDVQPAAPQAAGAGADGR